MGYCDYWRMGVGLEMDEVRVLKVYILNMPTRLSSSTTQPMYFRPVSPGMGLYF
jgi:hypothetical protein